MAMHGVTRACRIRMAADSALVAGCCCCHCFFCCSVNKEDRSSFIRDNDADAEKHHEHFLRTVSRSRPNSDIMPSLNKVRTQTDSDSGRIGRAASWAARWAEMCFSCRDGGVARACPVADRTARIAGLRWIDDRRVADRLAVTRSLIVPSLCPFLSLLVCRVQMMVQGKVRE